MYDIIMCENMYEYNLITSKENFILEVLVKSYRKFNFVVLPTGVLEWPILCTWTSRKKYVIIFTGGVL